MPFGLSGISCAPLENLDPSSSPSRFELQSNLYGEDHLQVELVLRDIQNFPKLMRAVCDETKRQTPYLLLSENFTRQDAVIWIESFIEFLMSLVEIEAIPPKALPPLLFLYPETQTSPVLVETGLLRFCKKLEESEDSFQENSLGLICTSMLSAFKLFSENGPTMSIDYDPLQVWSEFADMIRRSPQIYLAPILAQLDLTGPQKAEFCEKVKKRLVLQANGITDRGNAGKGLPVAIFETMGDGFFHGLDRFLTECAPHGAHFDLRDYDVLREFSKPFMFLNQTSYLVDFLAALRDTHKNSFVHI